MAVTSFPVAFLVIIVVCMHISLALAVGGEESDATKETRYITYLITK